MYCISVYQDFPYSPSDQSTKSAAAALSTTVEPGVRFSHASLPTGGPFPLVRRVLFMRVPVSCSFKFAHPLLLRIAAAPRKVSLISA
jgi:hypothetical protein